MGLTEIALILVVALILFGPEDLPVFARAFGKIVYQVRKYANEITKEFKDVIDTPSNVAKDVLKVPEKGSKGKVLPEGAPELKNEDDNDEEFLTYEDEKVIKDEKKKEEPEDLNPLSELPADTVSQPKDKQAGE